LVTSLSTGVTSHTFNHSILRYFSHFAWPAPYRRKCSREWLRNGVCCKNPLAVPIRVRNRATNSSRGDTLRCWRVGSTNPSPGQPGSRINASRPSLVRRCNFVMERLIDCTHIQSCPTMFMLSLRQLAKNNEPESLASIMHSLKRNTSRRANQILNRSGQFWEHESFDHYIRNQSEFNRIIKYALENPVKAGLVKSWREWPWNYVRDSLPTPDAN
jgi:hypothetical protein